MPINQMKSIPELFRAQAEQTPESIAIAFGDVALTYRDLNRRADELASRLRRLGVGPDVRVAIYLDRSIELVVAMLGVLKAGGAYVPLDPLHPPQRLAYIMEDAEPLVLLTRSRLRLEAPANAALTVLVDAAAPPPRAEPVLAEAQPPGPNDLAYLIYTSGSTGQPKGVQIEHRAVVNLLASMRRRPGLGADDILLAITTSVFDISVLEIFLPLVCGARVVIAPSEAVVDGVALIDLIERSGATILQATPSTMRMLLDAGWAGSPHLKLLCGGEAWSAELAERLLARCGSLWNMYGPTETTVWSAVAKVEASQPVVIGPPIANTRLYVLDGALQLVPVGVTGELFIGGEGLARGYHNRPDLTGERFLPDPFASSPGARMYRTGDLVRRKPDGSIEFLGRIDHQVKIRGHRVELGEIEAALIAHPNVDQCVVVASEGAGADQRLVAYLIPAGSAEASVSALRSFLSETLPSHMIPSNFVSLTSFPLTANGKLDRKALPSPDAPLRSVDVGMIVPRTPIEEQLASIWCELLGCEEVGVRDNFFDLGGHSLLATRVIGRINQTLRVRIPVPAFFQNPTIEGLAAALQQSQLRPEPRLLTLQRGASRLPLYFVGVGPGETQIAQLMGKSRAVYGIDVPIEWREADDASLPQGERPSIERLARLHSQLLAERVGSEPLVIAGYSMWGRIAFETARALQEAGGKIAIVLLLDARSSFATGTIRGAAMDSFRWIWRDGAGLGASLADSGRLLLWLLAQLPQAARNRFLPKERLSGYLDFWGEPIRQTRINSLNRLLEKSYRPQRLDARGVLLRASFPGDNRLPGYDFTNGWRTLFGKGLEIVEAGGDHLSIAKQQNVAQMAQLINVVLNRYELTESSAGTSAATERQVAIS